MLRLLSRAALAFLGPMTVPAQTRGQSPAPVAPVARDMLSLSGKGVTVSLVTVGSGDQVWQLFGHTAIWIHDDMSGRDTVFNWGAFDSRTHFVLRFLQSVMLYQMDGGTMVELLSDSRYFDRRVTAQELDLSAAQKDSLMHIVAVNARPENRRYRYDYFLNNCSTRVRDILDHVLGGQLRGGADSITRASYRWYTLRQVQRNWPVLLGVDIGLGEPADRPINIWQTMFLPRELHDWVATRQILDASGATHPLVRAERVLYRSTRPPEPSAPPRLGPWLTMIGLLIAALLAWLGLLATNRSHRARFTASIAFGIWSFTCGLLGLLLTLLWTVTDHRFAYANENLLLFHPIWFVLVVVSPLHVMRGSAARTMKVAAATVVALSAVALLLHLVGLSRQDNLGIIGLALPATLVLARRAALSGSAS